MAVCRGFGELGEGASLCEGKEEGYQRGELWHVRWI